MQKSDLIDYSPVKLFNEAASGALKDGEMGLVTAKKGLGKTSILVQFGIDSLINDKPLVHVSFDQRSSNVIAWYDSVLSEVAKKKHLNLEDIADDIMRDRTILNFNQENFTLPKVINTIKALKEGGISIKTLVVDGLNLAKIDTADIACVKSYAESEGMTIWFSHTTEEADLKNQLPEDKLGLFTTVSHLSANGTAVTMNILKPVEACVKIDAKTMLMIK